MAYDVNEGAKQVQDNYQNLKNNYRFNAGMDLLGQMYGPVAWVPEQATATENYLYTKANNPLLLAQQGIKNGQDQQNLDYSRAADPLRVKSLGLLNDSQAQTNAFNAQNDPLRVQQGQQTVAKGQTELDAAKAAQTRTALASLVGTLGAKVDGGADPAATFDAATMDISKLTGYPPEQLAPYRELFIKDPKATVARLQAALGATDAGALTPTQQAELDAKRAGTALTDAQTVNLGVDNARMAAAQADKSALTQAQIDKLNADTAKIQAIIADPQAYLKPGSPAKMAAPDTLDGMQQRYALLSSISQPFAMQAAPGGALEQAARFADDLSSSQVMNKAALAAGVGSATNLMSQVDTLKANLSLLDLRNLRQYGLSLGRTNLAEFKAAADAFVNIDPNTMQKSDIQAAIKRLTDEWGKLNIGTETEMATLGGKIQAAGGMLPDDPNFQSGVTAPAPAAAAQATSPPAAPATSPPAAPATNPASAPAGDLDMPRAAAAIQTMESGGDYSVVNKDTGAVGAYQVIPANIGPWTQKYVGRAMTPAEFAADPAAQDAVFQGEFGRLASLYGPEGAAQAWLGGPGSVGKANGPADANGTTTNAYGARFSSLYGGTGSVPGPAGMGPREQGTLVDEGGVQALDAARAAAVAPQPNVAQPAQSQAAPAAPAQQQVASPAPGPVGGGPAMTAENLRNPDFVIPGSGGQTVGQALMEAREALKRGWSMQQIAARAQQFGIPTEMITGRQR